MDPRRQKLPGIPTIKFQTASIIQLIDGTKQPKEATITRSAEAEATTNGSGRALTGGLSHLKTSNRATKVRWQAVGNVEEWMAQHLQRTGVSDEKKKKKRPDQFARDA